mgnify:CR=1 FL=1
MNELLLILTLATESPTCSPTLLDAIEHVESRGNPIAVSSTGALGLLQVQPQWAKVPRWALWVPSINRAEGCRILRRWHRRAISRCAWERRKRMGSCSVTARALAAYNAGVAGLRGRSKRGRGYAWVVMRRARITAHQSLRFSAL